MEWALTPSFHVFYCACVSFLQCWEGGSIGSSENLDESQAALCMHHTARYLKPEHASVSLAGRHPEHVSGLQHPKGKRLENPGLSELRRMSFPWLPVGHHSARAKLHAAGRLKCIAFLLCFGGSLKCLAKRRHAAQRQVFRGVGTCWPVQLRRRMPNSTSLETELPTLTCLINAPGDQ